MAMPIAKLMTAEGFFDFCQQAENRDRSFELERGEVVEQDRPGERHGVVCADAIWLLESFVHERQRGYVLSNNSGVILERDPDTVNGPDAVLYDESRAYDDLEVRFTDRIPALIVEVLSPSDRPGKVARRVSRFLDADVPLVWIVDPDARNITVYRADQSFSVFEEGQEITGMDVVPDLKLQVADFFAMPGIEKE